MIETRPIMAWVVMECPVCDGKGGSHDDEDENRYYECGLCKGKHFVRVNPNRLEAVE